MKITNISRNLLPLALGAALGGSLLTHRNSAVLPSVMAAEAQADSENKNSGLSALQAEVNRLKGVVGDQSHAMADVGYHFANLWFAGARKNWPLATFYLDETRSHLNWAVRIIPVRKDASGREVDLKGILDGFESSILIGVKKAIESKDSERFIAAYKQTIEGCYACHKASSKPFLRPQIPQAPPQPILNFDSDAKWPE